MKKYLTSIVTFAVVLCCISMHSTAQVNVVKVSGENVNPLSDGLFYSLPRTVIKVDLVVNKITNVKGPYAEFADKYLGLSQVILTNSTEYSLSEIRLSTFEESDPSEYYFVQIPEKSKSREAIQLTLSQMGTLVGIRGGESSGDQGKGVKIASSSVELNELPSPNTFERIDTLIRRISVDTTMIEQRVFKKVTAAKTPDQKAKEAADFIMKLDESKFNLINGYQEVNYEKGTMEFMYNQMEELMNDYLQMFKGIRIVTSESYTFTVIPAAESAGKPFVLCRFSPGKGISDKNGNSGDIVQLQVDPSNSLQQVKNVISERNKGEKAKGLYYRIPEK
ncbi:MAG TPA: DUF4831 family protein, partial [Bacteroidales bacterium]|nr:DUF4831 family protein [Bacteroidales bacterium]